MFFLLAGMYLFFRIQKPFMHRVLIWCPLAWSWERVLLFPPLSMLHSGPLIQFPYRFTPYLAKVTQESFLSSFYSITTYKVLFLKLQKLFLPAQSSSLNCLAENTVKTVQELFNFCFPISRLLVGLFSVNLFSVNSRLREGLVTGNSHCTDTCICASCELALKKNYWTSGWA